MTASSPSQEPSRGELESVRLWRLAGAGGTMASEVIAGVVIGLVLDWAFGSRPWCVLAFTLAGMVFGMRSFIRKARQEQSLHGQRRAVTREEGNPR